MSVDMKARQKVFNKVASHLLRQKKAARRVYYDTCQLITEDNKRCSLGCLLSINETNGTIKWLQSVLRFPSCIRALSEMQADSRWKFIKHGQQEYIKLIKEQGYKLTLPEDMYFLGKLQAIHDCHEPNEWSLQLLAFAKEYNLNENYLYMMLNGTYKEPQQEDIDVTAGI